MPDHKLKALLGVEKLREAFKTLKEAFIEGGGRCPMLAGMIDHSQLALEHAGVDVGPPPELGDTLEFDDENPAFAVLN